MVDGRPTHFEVVVRQFSGGDSLEELVGLLHRAYQVYIEQGLDFAATRQTVAETAARMAKGECWVAFVDGRLVATRTLYPPGTRSSYVWYDHPKVAWTAQAAVEPEFQGSNVFGELALATEARARQLGASELACDTSDRAVERIAKLEASGYRLVDYTYWGKTNYRSAVFSKQLGDERVEIPWQRRAWSRLRALQRRARGRYLVPLRAAVRRRLSDMRNLTKPPRRQDQRLEDE